MTLTDCMSRKEGGSGLPSTGDSVHASIQRLEDNIEHGGRLITATRSNTDDTRISRTEISGNKSGKKNNSMDVLSDEQAGKRGRGKERKTLREKANIF